jgi:EAL domain-containing protein (putative c-di-GMP-specific phosphodiesterase class I)
VAPIPAAKPEARTAQLQRLRAAIGAGELLLHHQPKVELATGRITAVECLVRWQPPGRPMLYPDQFISVAEQGGLIRTLTRTVLEMALVQLRAWNDAGIPLSVGVNLSMRDVEDPKLAAHLEKRLSHFDLSPELLVLEITEGMVMAQPRQAIEGLNRLKEIGVKLNIDDFGVGQSSLAYVRQLPADEIKIDRSFCIDMDDSDIVIVRSAIRMSHDLGFSVVAEGIESRATAELLRSMGCDVGQGFYFGRPMQAQDIAGRVADLHQHLPGGS